MKNNLVLTKNNRYHYNFVIYLKVFDAAGLKKLIKIRFKRNLNFLKLKHWL